MKNPVVIISGILGVSFLMYFGRGLFIPLTVALLISFILYPICHSLEKRGMKPVFAVTISMLGVLILLVGLFSLIIWQVSQFSTDWPLLIDKIEISAKEIGEYIYLHYNISIADQENWLHKMSDNSGAQVIPFLKTTFSSIAYFGLLFVLVPIISILILLQRQQLFEALKFYLPHIASNELKNLLYDTITTYYKFIKGMLIVYLTVGILNSIGLYIIGVPHAFLFGFTTAILTFIPYVGIIIGSIPPIILSWITFNSIWYPAGVILVFTIVQYLEANLIFPWAVSNKLQINTLSTIIAILAGGIIWGSAGMILFIPFLGILKLIADKTKGMEGISILLSTKSNQDKKQK
jgi:predicted PurR-regulated permease PerM